MRDGYPRAFPTKRPQAGALHAVFDYREAECAKRARFRLSFLAGITGNHKVWLSRNRPFFWVTRDQRSKLQCPPARKALLTFRLAQSRSSSSSGIPSALYGIKIYCCRRCSPAGGKPRSPNPDGLLRFHRIAFIQKSGDEL